MKATNIEIAGCALCSETAVRGAIERGRLDPSRLESVVGFVMGLRFKQLGISGGDDLVAVDKPARMVVASDLPFEEPTVDYSNSQESDESEY
jgi:hypothetical protein